MAEIFPFKKPKPSEKHKGSTLCRSGFHKWQIENKQQFDVKQGRLITRTVCQRCGKIKTKAV